MKITFNNKKDITVVWNKEDKKANFVVKLGFISRLGILITGAIKIKMTTDYIHPEFKYDVGQTMSHLLDESKKPHKLIILERRYLQEINGTNEYSYTLTNSDCTRLNLYEEEIVPYVEKDFLGFRDKGKVA